MDYLLNQLCFLLSLMMYLATVSQLLQRQTLVRGEGLTLLEAYRQLHLVNHCLIFTCTVTGRMLYLVFSADTDGYFRSRGSGGRYAYLQPI